MKGERMIWLDSLRAMAICAVVFMHTMTGSMDILTAPLMERGRLMMLFMDLTTWCVPVFLMISGALFLNPQRELTVSRMLRKYCLRIALVILVFGIPFALMELIMTQKDFRLGMLPESLRMVLAGKSWSHMWYLYLILLLYLVTPLLRLCIRHMRLWMVTLATVLVLIGSSLLPFLNKLGGGYSWPMLPEAFVYPAYYLTGYLCFRLIYRVREGGLEKRWLKACLAALFATLLFLGISRIAGFSLQMAYNYPFTVLLSTELFLVMGLLHPVRLGVVGTELSRISFAVYLIHPVFLNIFYKVLGITPLDYPFLVSLTVFSLVTLFLSAAASLVLFRIPFLRRLVA